MKKEIKESSAGSKLFGPKNTQDMNYHVIVGSWEYLVDVEDLQYPGGTSWSELFQLAWKVKEKDREIY